MKRNKFVCQEPPQLGYGGECRGRTHIPFRATVFKTVDLPVSLTLHLRRAGLEPTCPVGLDGRSPTAFATLPPPSITIFISRSPALPIGVCVSFFTC